MPKASLRENLIKERDSSVVEFTPPKAGLPTNDIQWNSEIPVNESMARRRSVVHFLLLVQKKMDEKKRTAKSQPAFSARADSVLCDFDWRQLKLS